MILLAGTFPIGIQIFCCAACIYSVPPVRVVSVRIDCHLIAFAVGIQVFCCTARIHSVPSVRMIVTGINPYLIAFTVGIQPLICSARIYSVPPMGVVSGRIDCYLVTCFAFPCKLFNMTHIAHSALLMGMIGQIICIFICCGVCSHAPQIPADGTLLVILMGMGAFIPYVFVCACVRI